MSLPYSVITTEQLNNELDYLKGKIIAIYVRVSTEQQAREGYSLDAQIELCIDKAKRMGYDESLIVVYKEEGFTGEDIDRPALNQLRDDIKAHSFTHVIMTDPDRFSREMIEKLMVCNEFEKHDIQLLFTDADFPNTPEGQLFFNMKSAFSQYELSLIKKRTTRGRIKAIQKDNKIMPMRTAPYGYDLVECKLIVNEKEAEFVKLVYQWYVYDNLTMRQIGEKLASLGATPKRGESKNWSASSIMRILTSEIYIGKYVYNKRKSEKLKGQKTASGKTKKTYKYRDSSEWVTANVPAIVEIGLFELAQQQKDRNKKVLSGNVKYEYLLKSLIKCKHCGKVWHGTSYNGRNGKKYPVYRCGGKFLKRYGEDVEGCNSDVYTIRTELLDDYVWSKVKEVLLNPDSFTSDLAMEEKSATDSIISLLETIKKQIETKEKEREKVKLMFMKEVITEDEMTNDMVRINKVVGELKKEEAKLKSRIENESRNKESVIKLQEIAKELRDRVMNEDELTFQMKRHIIEMFVEEIYIESKDNEITLTFIGFMDEFNNLNVNQVNSDIALCSQHQENVNTKRCNEGINITYKTGFKLMNVDKNRKVIEEIPSYSALSIG